MAVSRRGILAIVSVCVLVLAPVAILGFTHLSAPVVPFAGAESAQLDSCTTITEPGTYHLSRDIESSAETCMQVSADDVVISGKYHSIDGGVFRENSTAIAVTGENVTVRNLSVRQWTFGIRYENAPDGVVRNVTTWRTVDGVTFSSSPNASAQRVSATNSVSGISFVDSDAGVVRNSVVRYQSSTGVFVADSRRIAVSNTTVARSEIGIALLGSHQGRVNDSVIRATGKSALLLVDSHTNSIGNVTLSNPGRNATVLLSNASQNRIVGTTGNWTFKSVSGAKKNSVVNATASDSVDAVDAVGFSHD